jgi:hypothetical protein
MFPNKSQGYLYAEPRTAAEIEKMLRERRVRAVGVASDAAERTQRLVA